VLIEFRMLEKGSFTMHELKFGVVPPGWVPVPQQYAAFVDSSFHVANDVVGTIGLGPCVGVGLWYGKRRGVLCHFDSECVPGKEEDCGLESIFRKILEGGRKKGWGIPRSAVIATNSSGSVQREEVRIEGGALSRGYTRWTVETLWRLCTQEGISPVMIRTTASMSLYLNLATGKIFQCQSYPGLAADRVARDLAESNLHWVDYRRLNTAFTRALQIQPA
jgi:hypothetical protein